MIATIDTKPEEPAKNAPKAKAQALYSLRYQVCHSESFQVKTSKRNVLPNNSLRNQKAAETAGNGYE